MINYQPQLVSLPDFGCQSTVVGFFFCWEISSDSSGKPILRSGAIFKVADLVPVKNIGPKRSAETQMVVTFLAGSEIWVKPPGFLPA